MWSQRSSDFLVAPPEFWSLPFLHPRPMSLLFCKLRTPLHVIGFRRLQANAASCTMPNVHKKPSPVPQVRTEPCDPSAPLAHLGPAKDVLTPKARCQLHSDMVQHPAHCLIRTPIIGIFSNTIKYRILYARRQRAPETLEIIGALRSFSVCDGERGKPGDVQKNALMLSRCFQLLMENVRPRSRPLL